MSAAGADIRSEFTRLFDLYWAIGAGVWFVVLALLVAFVLRWRARAGEEDELPGGRDSSRPLELGYAALVACLAAVLLYLTYTTMDSPAYRATAQGNVPGRTPPGAELVDVVGARWHWRFSYPRHAIDVVGTDTRRPTLTVPEDTPIELRMTSLDVIHGVWIPARRFKADVFPDRVTRMTVTFPDPGLEREGGECNQFCGLRHALMTFDIRILTRAAYAGWVRRHAGGAA